MCLCVFVCLRVCTLEPFPPPDDFRLRSIFLQRLWFTWTANETYRNCASFFRIYLTNCTSTCQFSSDRVTIVCSDISTVARICLFQLQYSICDDIQGNASDPVYVTLKGTTIISWLIYDGMHGNGGGGEGMGHRGALSCGKLQTFL